MWRVLIKVSQVADNKHKRYSKAYKDMNILKIHLTVLKGMKGMKAKIQLSQSK